MADPDGIRSYPLVVVEVSADSHPFWTGRRRLVDAQARSRSSTGGTADARAID
jgi:ribosomal protein L31